jgi:hypothetical protein
VLSSLFPTDSSIYPTTEFLYFFSRSLVLSFIHLSFFHSFVYSVIPSLINSQIHSFKHSLNNSLLLACNLYNDTVTILGQARGTQILQKSRSHLKILATAGKFWHETGSVLRLGNIWHYLRNLSHHGALVPGICGFLF